MTYLNKHQPKIIFLKENKEYSKEDISKKLTEEEFKSIKEVLYEREILKKKKKKYLLKYVGVIVLNNIIINVLPKVDVEVGKIENDGYINLILKVLKKYKTKGNVKVVNESEYVYSEEEEEEEKDGFFSLIDFLMEDYMEYGLYNPQSCIMKQIEGEIDWGYTMDKTLPLYINNRFLYLETYSKFSRNDEHNFIKKLHMVILNECSEYLDKLKKYEAFSGYPTLDFNIDLFIDESEEYILYEIEKELHQEFNDRNIRLLKGMQKYIKNKNSFEEEHSNLFFGVRKFETVWEEICSYLLNNQYKKLKINDIMVKYSSPTWFIKGSNSSKTYENQRYKPDIVRFNDCLKKLFILDAKYYNIQILNEKYSNIPKMGDVSKEFLYKEILKKYYDEEGITLSKITNGFIFPKDFDGSVKNVGNVKMNYFDEEVKIYIVNFLESLRKYSQS